MTVEPLGDSQRTFLASLLEVILTKMKWDEAPDPDDADEDDIAEFDKMRKASSNF
jgi:exportin-T